MISHNIQIGNRHSLGKETNSEAWKDLAYLIRSGTKYDLSCHSILGHNGWREKEGMGSIARNQARMSFPLPKIQRKFKNMKEKGQAGQAHPKAGLSLPTCLQGPEGK